MRRLILLVSISLSVAAAACADQSTSVDIPAAPGAGGDGATGPNGGPPIDWSHPLKDGVSLTGPAAAANKVSFNAVDPGIGTPTLVQMDDPTQVDPSTETVAYVYSLPSIGTINVEERPAAQGMADNLVARANAFDAEPSPDPSEPQFQMVQLGSGQALLVTQGGVGAITWVQGGILFSVTGPTVSPDDVQNLAAEVYAAAASS